MSSHQTMKQSTASYSALTAESSEARNVVTSAVRAADAVVVGAGAGLSTAAGLEYGGARFQLLFGDFIAAYGLRDMYSAGFHPFETLEERWAYWSRHVMANRYDQPKREVYGQLLSLLSGSNYFVITTNVDSCFVLNGFDPDRVFAIQGDYGLFQCSIPCRAETWSNERAVRAMVAQQQAYRIPVDLLPRCPWCGAPAMMNLRIDNRFVQDRKWDESAARYTSFLAAHETGRALYLEIGVGWNTPSIIKYPFWQRVHANPEATYLTINPEVAVPTEIQPRTIALHMDAAALLAN